MGALVWGYSPSPWGPCLSHTDYPVRKRRESCSLRTESEASVPEKALLTSRHPGCVQPSCKTENSPPCTPVFPCVLHKNRLFFPAAGWLSVVQSPGIDGRPAASLVRQLFSLHLPVFSPWSGKTWQFHCGKLASSSISWSCCWNEIPELGHRSLAVDGLGGRDTKRCSGDVTGE